VWGSRLADHAPEADEIYVDGIAVAGRARGLGIGTQLLDEIRSLARAHGKQFVRLDVIDTNPRAQALYERLGYRVTKVESFRWKQRWVGFGAMISMEQPVEAQAAPALEGPDVGTSGVGGS
jgi:L-amino acid N-acyltransferase YncA